MTKHFKLSSQNAFTIVELLVVIVVIGILAAITIVSYSGITNRAKIASIQSDLSNSAQLLKMFNIDNGSYPATISTDCVASPTTTTNLCLKPSTGNDFTSTPYSRPTPQTFVLTVANGSLKYYITEGSTPTAGSSLAAIDPANWISIGSQVWAKYNLNVGTRIAGMSAQTNNGGTNIIEKYCYSDSDANCTANNNGGLYQWDEAMNYSTSEGAQGICPTGSHIPTDNEWKTLEIYLGMTSEQADLDDVLRGITEGAKLKVTGSSGLEVPLAGYRVTGGFFNNISTYAHLWTSSESGVSAWNRYLYSGDAIVSRNIRNKAYGFSVRCVGN